MNTFFPQIDVKILTESDFLTDSDDKILLKDKRTCVVLFHNKESVSQHLTDIWKNLASRVAGPIFCVCDMTIQRNISEAFLQISQDDSSSYQKYAKKKIPFILIYRNGRPQSTYNGQLSGAALMNYCSGLVSSHISNSSSDTSDSIVDSSSSNASSSETKDDSDDTDVPKPVRKSKDIDTDN